MWTLMWKDNYAEPFMIEVCIHFMSHQNNKHGKKKKHSYVITTAWTRQIFYTVYFFFFTTNDDGNVLVFTKDPQK